MRLYLTAFILLLININPVFAKGEISLSAMVDSLKGALLIIEQTHTDFPLKFEKAFLEVNVVADQESSGGFDFFVISLSKEHVSGIASKITIELSPPDKKSENETSVGDFEESIVNAVVAATSVMKKASTGKPPLEMEKLLIDLRFSIDVNDQGKAKISFNPFGVSGGLKKTSSEYNSIKVLFVNE